MKAFLTSSATVLAIALGSAGFVGCASQHEEGVKSSYHSQWTKVAADTEATTNAARAVLEDRGLKNVTSSATKLDGKASGKLADNTEVKVTVNKDGTATSQVSVTVGTLGDPALGAEIARAIKDRAEMPPSPAKPM